MNKTAKIILTVVSILLVLGFAAWFFVPRILLAAGTRAIVPDVGEAAAYFTEYDIRCEDVQTIDNGYIAIDIPAYYLKRETKAENVAIYSDPDTGWGILLGDADDMSELNLFDEENNVEDLTSQPLRITKRQLKKGFKALGNGLPDSAYNTYKSVLMLDAEDNSFWNFNQAAAFLTAGTLKNVMTYGETTLVYETDEICGFMSYTKTEEDSYRVALDIYRTDDLNTVSLVVFIVEDLDVAYAIMNSARAVE